MELFLKKLKDKKYEINILKLNQVEEITILYDKVELIVIEISKDKKISIISSNDVLNIYLPKSIEKLEELDTYLEKFKKKIDESNPIDINDDYDDDYDDDYNKIYNQDSCNFIVREIQQQMGFLTLMEYFDKGIYKIPKNQRNYVWTKDQVEELAVSLIRGYPIPPIYCYRNDKNQLVILDGQQRLMSLYLYYKNSYLKNTSKTPIDLREILTEDSNNNELILEQLNRDYGIRNERYFFKTRNTKTKEEKVEEITYEKLSKEVKRIVDFRVINIIEIFVQSDVNIQNNQNDVNKEEIFFKIFGNLNQGGTELKNQELRNGIYQCQLYDMLHDINNTNKKWRKIYGPKHRHSRDVELLLRFVATDYMFKIKDNIVNISGFENSYPKFLNDFSKKALNFTQTQVKDFEKKIITFFDKIEGRERIPNLLLESLFFASTHLTGNYTINEEIINEIVEDSKYKQCIGASSSSKQNVKNRLEIVYQKLKNKIGDNNKNGI